MSFGAVRQAITTVVIAAALVAGFAGDRAAAQDSTDAPDTISETYGSWVLRCGAKGSGCHVFQALYRAKDGAQLIQITIFTAAGEGGGTVLRALTPLGVKLAAGAVLSIDGSAPQTVPFDACWQRGCVAETPLSSELEAALRAGLALEVAVVGADTGQTVRFKLSLDGIGRAMDRFEAM